MKSTVILFAGLAAAELVARAVPDAHVVSLDFQKQRKQGSGRHPGRSKTRRRSTVVTSLDNEYLLYYVDVKIGTPPQSLRIQVDTGSSDVWAPASTSKYCKSSDDPCSEGTYDPALSSSSKVVDPNGFSISYVDGTHARGDFVSEVFQIGNITVKDLRIGVGYNTDIGAGILGIGFEGNSVSEDTSSSLLDMLVENKYINSRAYSLWLNDQDADTGSILFGGIDTDKYVGNLIGLPILKDSGSDDYTDFLVTLSSVNFVGMDGNKQLVSNDTLAVILDSGSSLTYLPNDTVQNIAYRYGGVWNSQVDAYLMPCSLSNDYHDYVEYQFGGAHGPLIRVPIEELINYVIDTNGDIWADSDGNAACTLGLQPQPDDFGDTYLFGDTFLRSAYVVYDLDGKRIYLGQTVFNATDSHILEIQNSTSSKNGVPEVSGVASATTAFVMVTTVVKPRPTSVTGQSELTAVATTPTDLSSQPTSTQGSDSSGPGKSGSDTTKPNAGARVEVGEAVSVIFTILGCLLGMWIY
ncbi:Candidapepsin-4 [Arthrobotrys entomopaga]|nr:Candidapepsin-4 [Arthrobotrys entomopaga]